MPVNLLDDPKPLGGLRGQIRDLKTENIALLATRAKAIPDVIPLCMARATSGPRPSSATPRRRRSTTAKPSTVPDMRGASGLVAALSEYQTRLHGKPIAPQRSTVTPGGMQAVYMALQLVVDPGCNVVFIEPQWPNIASAIHLAAAEPRPVPLDFDTDWRIDLDRVFAACDARTRAIMLSRRRTPAASR